MLIKKTTTRVPRFCENCCIINGVTSAKRWTGALKQKTEIQLECKAKGHIPVTFYTVRKEVAPPLPYVSATSASPSPTTRTAPAPPDQHPPTTANNSGGTHPWAEKNEKWREGAHRGRRTHAHSPTHTTTHNPRHDQRTPRRKNRQHETRARPPVLK